MRAEIRQLCDRLMAEADDAVVVDFETYYDDVVSVRKLGNYAYTHHPKWDAYLVTVYGRGVDFVGHPSEFDWRSIDGRVWLMHNDGFDRACVGRLKEIFAIPADVNPSRYVDTASLARYVGLPGDLAGAAECAFGIRLNKEVRDVVMKGKYWHEFSAEVKQKVVEYAGDDGIAWALWQTYRRVWPETEKALSALTTECGIRGVPIDAERLEKCLDILRRAQWVARSEIPWADEEDEKGKPIALRSPKALANECVRCGVPVPRSTSAKDPKFQDWLVEYGERVPAVRALARLRRIERVLKVVEAIKVRVRPDGRLDAALIYFGAQNTGRWAGGGGVNLQNFPRDPFFFDAEYHWSTDRNSPHRVDLRSLIVGRLGIADLSQIEPRCLAWVVGDRPFLALCAGGQSPYEAHARVSMNWTGGVLKKEAPGLYSLAKARVLALGYGAGWRKFIEMAAGYISPEEFESIFTADCTLDEEKRFLEFLDFCKDPKSIREYQTILDGRMRRIWVNSYKIVSDFRRSNPLIASRREPLGIWQQLEEAFKSCVRDGTFELELPSGRSLYYFDIHSTTARGDYRARQGNRAGDFEKIYGGLLTENMIQAIARDVFAAGILRLESRGYRVLFTVHDEVICELQEGQSVEEMIRILTEIPEWAAGLPVAAEGAEHTHYVK